MKRLRATGFGPFRGNDGLTPRERRALVRKFHATIAAWKTKRPTVRIVAEGQYRVPKTTNPATGRPE